MHMHESLQPRGSAARSLDEVLDRLWITLTHRRGEMVPREQLRELASNVSHEARSRGMVPEQLVVAVKARWRRHPKLRDAYSRHEALGTPGTLVRMRAADVRPLFDQLPAFRTLLLRYAHAFLVQVAQTASCNLKHDLDQRCARWLLMTHDRVATATFGLTQRLLGVMLGVHRPAVTICLQTLQRAGLITYTRGSITIVDRQALEAASCECYVIVRDHFSRLCRTVA